MIVNVTATATATAIGTGTGTGSEKKRESAIGTGNVLESETEIESETENDLGATGPNPQLTVIITHVKQNEDVKTTLAPPPAIETVQKTQGRRLF